jgi:hypothetical protein
MKLKRDIVTFVTIVELDFADIIPTDNSDLQQAEEAYATFIGHGPENFSLEWSCFYLSAHCLPLNNLAALRA